MSSTHYFEFLGSVWDQLPEADRERFGELWQGYEQVLAAVYQKYVELTLNGAVSDMVPYTTDRWMPYTFNDSNYLDRPATITSSQDMSAGPNLTTKYLLKFRLDDTRTFEINVQGRKPSATTINEVIKKINVVANFPFASGVYNNTVVRLASNTTGVDSSIEVLPTSTPSANACEYILGIVSAELPKLYPKFRYPYKLPYTDVASIPKLQDAIRDETVTLTLYEGDDYEVDTASGVISFREIPPENLWAVRTHVNEEAPWSNFGFLTDIYQPNTPRYVGVIQGLWFALWNGPKPKNIRRSLYLLFGLPTAREICTVTAVVPNTDDATGYITTLGDNGISRTFDIPSGLYPEVEVGQRLGMFDPLVDGIQVYDKLNSPGFIEREVGREGIQRFLTENATLGTGTAENPTDEDKALKILEEYTFLPQISVDSFIFPDINVRNVMTFLDSFRPLNKAYLFQVIVGSFKELLGLADRISMHENLDLTSTLDSNEVTDLWTYIGPDYEPVDETKWVPPSIPYLNDDYTGGDYDALNLDPHGILFEDTVQIDVCRCRANPSDPLDPSKRPTLVVTDPVDVAPGSGLKVYRNCQVVFAPGTRVDDYSFTL